MVITEQGSTGYRRWLGIYLVFVAAVSTTYGYLSARRDSRFAVGEWVINYSAGFVRRGLPGEVILVLGHASGVKLAWLALAMQVMTYLTFLWCVYRIAKDLRWDWMVTALLLSPATLSFIVLDPPDGFKKEILLFAALAMLICALLYARLPDWQLTVLMSVGGLALVLSHESLIFYMPYFVAAIAVKMGNMRRTLRLLMCPTIFSGVAAIEVMLHHGDRGMAEKICSSVGGTLGTFDVYDAGICGGAILWLEQSWTQAHAYVMGSVWKHHLFPLYGPLAALALAPCIPALMMLYRRGAAQREVKSIIICSLVSVAGSLTLFYSGRDWGRWIHIHAVCLMLLVLMVHRNRPSDANLTVPLQGARRWAAAGLLILYATCWTLPQVDIYPARFGYFGLYRYLRQYNQTHRDRSDRDRTFNSNPVQASGAATSRSADL